MSERGRVDAKRSLTGLWPAFRCFASLPLSLTLISLTSRGALVIELPQLPHYSQKRERTKELIAAAEWQPITRSRGHFSFLPGASL